MKTIEEMKTHIKATVDFEDKLTALNNMELMTDDQIKRIYLVIVTAQHERTKGDYHDHL